MKKFLLLIFLLLPVPALAVKVVSGSFAANTSTGNQTIDTGVDSVLKAIIFYGAPQIATGYEDQQRGFIGFATSSSAEKGVAWASGDGLATTNTGKIIGDSCIIIITDPTPTINGAAQFVSFGTAGDAGKFTITWDDAPAGAYLIYYQAFYGDNLTNAIALEYTHSSGTGDEGETGFGFQPDFLFFVCTNQATKGSEVGMNVGIGMTSGFGECYSTTICAPDGDGAGGYTTRSQQTSAHRSLLTYNNNLSIVVTDSFRTFDSDGFTHYKLISSGASLLVFALGLKGGSYQVGRFDSPTAGGTPQDQSVTTDFLPSGVGFLSTKTTTLNGNIAEAHLGIGAGFDSSGTAKEQTVWGVTDDVRNPTVTGERNDNTKSITIGTVGSPPSTVAEADYKTQTATSFTVTWTTIDAAAHTIGYVAFGPGEAGAAPEGNIRRQRLLRGN